MRVLIVNATGADEWRGGVERGITLAAQALAERGIEVGIMRAAAGPAPDAYPTWIRRTRPESRLVRRLRNRVLDFGVTSHRDIDRAVAASGADIVHTHNLPGITTAVWQAAARANVPVFHSLHDYYLLCPRASLMQRDGQPCSGHTSCAPRTRILMRPGAHVAVVSGVSAWLVEAHRHLFPHSSLKVLRNPMVAFDRYSMRPPSIDLPTIGYIGSLTPEKGINELLGAAQRLSGARCRFRIAGHGRLGDVVEAAARRLPNLVFDGTVKGEAKRAFFDSCDVGIIPSVWDEPGGPTHTVAEWLTAGRPALISLRGGLGESARIAAGAIAVEPTEDGIVEAVESLLAPGALRNAIDAVGTWSPGEEMDRWIEANLSIYERITSRSGSVAAAPLNPR